MIFHPVTLVANLLIIAGLYYIGGRKRWAFLLTGVGEAVWTVYSLATVQWDLAWICAIFTVLAVRNFVLWKTPAVPLAIQPAACPACGHVPVTGEKPSCSHP